MFDSQIANDIVEKNTDPRIQPSTEKRYIMHICNIKRGSKRKVVVWYV
jgi:hypothetical protein